MIGDVFSHIQGWSFYTGEESLVYESPELKGRMDNQIQSMLPGSKTSRWFQIEFG